MRKVFTAVAVCALAASLGLVSALSAAPGNKYASKTTPGLCEEADTGNITVTMNGPDTLWPPNHKAVPVSIQAVDPDGDEVTLLTGGAHNQFAEGTDGPEESKGSGNTPYATDVDPPAATDDETGGTATNDHGVRAERAGTDKAGRIYTLTYNATSGTDDQCMGEFTITVPHDQRGGAGWKQS